MIQQNIPCMNGLNAAYRNLCPVFPRIYVCNGTLNMIQHILCRILCAGIGHIIKCLRDQFLCLIGRDVIRCILPQQKKRANADNQHRRNNDQKHRDPFFVHSLSPSFPYFVQHHKRGAAYHNARPRLFQAPYIQESRYIFKCLSVTNNRLKLLPFFRCPCGIALKTPRRSLAAPDVYLSSRR